MLDELRAALHQSQHTDPLLPELAQQLSILASAASLEARLAAWTALQDWTRIDTRTLSAHDDSGSTLSTGDSARLRLLLHCLEVSAPVRERIQHAMGELLRESDATGLLAETGMPSDRGFLAEASQRVWAKILPEPRDPGNLDRFVRDCFRTSSHVTRFSHWPPELFQRMIMVIMPPPGSAAWASLSLSFANAVRLLCARAAAQGLTPKLRTRSRSQPVGDSPFTQLPIAAEALLRSAPEDRQQAALAWNQALAGCRDEMVEIHRQIGDEGISVDIVYGLDVLDRSLTRLELMGKIATTAEGLERATLIHRLLSRLVHHSHEQRQLTAHVSSNLRLLYRRIVERSGETGEHYIARDLGEYRHLLLAAAGGGILTVFTAAIKICVTGWHAPDFVSGLLYGLNYAISFMILHHCHLVLATKQPAMTAATLATIMRKSSGSDRIDQIVDRIARITHSQLAAAAGNVIAVGAGALALSNIWELIFGHTFLTAKAASDLYDAFGPATSGTVFYAAFTGVILWFSSVIGGWIDNWSAFNRIPQGLADSSWGARWADPWRKHISGWGTNISLGFMLGMTPALGHFFGIPLDVRHVTLSTGTLFMACGSLGEAWWSGGWFLNAIAGILVMFVLNLGVSFALSLYMALRAMEIPRADRTELLRRLLVRLVSHPGDFILPPRTALKGDTL